MAGNNMAGDSPPLPPKAERDRAYEIAARHHVILATPKSRSRFVQKPQGRSGPVIRIKNQ